MITNRRHAAAILKARAEVRQEVLVELLELVRELETWPGDLSDELDRVRHWALDRARHGCSELADAMGGYLCICEHASFSYVHGCMATGRKA